VRGVIIPPATSIIADIQTLINDIHLALGNVTNMLDDIQGSTKVWTPPQDALVFANAVTTHERMVSTKEADLQHLRGLLQLRADKMSGLSFYSAALQRGIEMLADVRGGFGASCGSWKQLQLAMYRLAAMQFKLNTSIGMSAQPVEHTKVKVEHLGNVHVLAVELRRLRWCRVPKLVCQCIEPGCLRYADN